MTLVPRLRELAGFLVPPLFALVGLVALWAAGVAVFDPKPYVLPSPGDVWSALWDTRSVLAGHAWVTLQEALAGLALGALFGSLVALVLALNANVRRAIQPLLVISQSIPMVVLAPVLIVWFGFGVGPKLLVVALISFFPIAVATLDALLAADDELLELVRSYGGGPLDALRLVQVPGAIAGFIAGLKVSAAYAMFGAVVAEWMGAENGLGVYLNRSQAGFRTDQIFAAVIVIAATSIVIFAAVSALAWAAMPWLRPSGDLESAPVLPQPIQKKAPTS